MALSVFLVAQCAAGTLARLMLLSDSAAQVLPG